MKRLLLLGVALLPIAAHAVEDPKPGAQDNRVRTVIYQPMNVVKVDAADLHVTTIQFAPDEKIGEVEIGAAPAWKHSEAGNILFLKPDLPSGAPKMPDTNMEVVNLLPDGKTRLYQFELVDHADAGDPAYSIVFRYPADAAAARRRAVEAMARKRVEAEARARLDQSTFYGQNRNWKYEARGSVMIQPAEVSDNGQQTVFRFPGRTKLPAIYEVTSNGEQLASLTVKDDMVVVNGVAPEWRLRDGKEVCDVRNLGFTPQGFNPGTGTTSPDVVRAVTEAGHG